MFVCCFDFVFGIGIHNCVYVHVFELKINFAFEHQQIKQKNENKYKTMHTGRKNNVKLDINQVELEQTKSNIQYCIGNSDETICIESLFANSKFDINFVCLLLNNILPSEFYVITLTIHCTYTICICNENNL